MHEALADIADAGYEGVEFAPFTLAKNPHAITVQQAEKLGEEVTSHGLTTVGFHWLLAAPTGMHLTSTDPKVRKSTTEFVQHLVRLCQAMGGEVLVWGSPKQRSYDATESYESVFSRAVEVLEQVAETAGEAGVRIALEPLGVQETNFLTTAQETIRLIDEVNHPACRLHLDVKAMASEDKPIDKIIEECADYTIHFHANDPNLRGPGQGQVDFPSVAQALSNSGYEGWVSVEVFDYTPNAPTIARESIAVLRESFPSTITE